MAKPAQSKGIPLLSLAILAGLCALAVDALHLQLERIGVKAMAAPLVDPSNTGLRKHYTGIKGLDGFLTTLVIIFQPIFTGEMPELSLFSFHFAGQIASVVTIMAVQGLRLGTRKSPTRLATLWGVIMQAVGFGVVMPLYYLLDLLFSSDDPKSLGLTDPARLHAIVPAFGLSFILPSSLQTLPVSADLRQILIAAWQPFPIYFGVLLWAFSQVVKRITITGGTRVNKSEADRQALDSAYGFAIAVGALTHWATISVILAATFAQDFLPAGVAEHLTPAKVFVPYAVHWYGPGTLASTMLQFLHYDQYIGAAAGLVWAATLANRAGVWSLNVEGIRRIVRDVLIMGPPSAVISLLWERDDAVLGSQ